MKPCSNPMCDICKGDGTWQHDAVGSKIERVPLAKQIPVYGDSISKSQIGWAEVHHDGSVVIAIAPGELAKTVAVKFVEQLEAFFVSFQYRRIKQEMTKELPRG